VRLHRAIQLVVALIVLAYATTHIAAIYREAINWDEFVLYHRAEVGAKTGVVDGGGRPGLGVVALIPFVSGCDSEIGVAHAVRLVWTLWTFGIFVGLYFVVRRYSRSWQIAALSVSCLACIPAVIRWSLHVRTDQPAVACALWAGIALLASRDRKRLAFLAGGLLGVGYLFSQKAVYVAAMAGVLAVGDLYIAQRVDWRREASRALSAIAAAVVVVATYILVVRAFFIPPDAFAVDRNLDMLHWYRYVLRYRVYKDMLPTLYPLLALLLIVFVASIRAFRLGATERRPALIALTIITLGIAVLRFHTATFPYFWITLGIFPAVAIGIGWSSVEAWLPRANKLIVACGALWFLALATRMRVETLADTQTAQRNAFAFVADLGPNARGFHADGALVCRRDPAPFPVFLGSSIKHRFGGPGGRDYMEKFIADFRSRPVSYIVNTYRLAVFPSAIRDFWNQHYVPYRANVLLAGKAVSGTDLVEIIVPGRYRWISPTAEALEIDGRKLTAGGAVDLFGGKYEVRVLGRGNGMLVLAVDEPPLEDSAPFYDRMPIAEQTGTRSVWW
jgi:hypothetical protein